MSQVQNVTNMNQQESYNFRYQNYSIELDCPPGGIRPNDLIAGVLKDTGMEASDFDTGAPFFGHQTWVLKASANKDEMFSASKPTFKSRITDLYNSGIIRYGTW
jgi:hypothetical protein